MHLSLESEERPEWLARWTSVSLAKYNNQERFICQACGSIAEVPTEHCSNSPDLRIGMGIPGMMPSPSMPCDLWPMTQEEYELTHKRKTPDACVFTGTVTFEDGTAVKVCIPMSNADAERFAIVEAEMRLRKDKKPTIEELQAAGLERLKGLIGADHIRNSQLKDLVDAQQYAQQMQNTYSKSQQRWTVTTPGVVIPQDTFGGLTGGMVGTLGGNMGMGIPGSYTLTNTKVSLVPLATTSSSVSASDQAKSLPETPSAAESWLGKALSKMFKE